MNSETVDGSVVIQPKNHKYSIIWMHGLGDVSSSWLDIFTGNQSVVHKDTKIISLQAPKRKVTINFGMESTSWFDITTFQFQVDKFDQCVSLQEIKESHEMITKYVKQECELVESKNVFIGGFSQGCCMALDVGFSYPETLGGIIGLSGFLFPTTQLQQVQETTPIILVNGDADPLINCQLAQLSQQRLNNQKRQICHINVIKHMGHECTIPVVKSLKQFMESIQK